MRVVDESCCGVWLVHSHSLGQCSVKGPHLQLLLHLQGTQHVLIEILATCRCF